MAPWTSLKRFPSNWRQLCYAPIIRQKSKIDSCFFFNLCCKKISWRWKIFSGWALSSSWLWSRSLPRLNLFRRRPPRNYQIKPEGKKKKKSNFRTFVVKKRRWEKNLGFGIKNFFDLPSDPCGVDAVKNHLERDNQGKRINQAGTKWRYSNEVQ